MCFFEFNRFLTALFMVGIFVVGGRILSDAIYSRPPLERPAYFVQGTEGSFLKKQVQKAASAIVEDITALMPKADSNSGKALARKCLQCHGFNEGGKNKVGPNLWDTVNQAIGNATGYSYSKAFKKLKGKWTIEDLNKFLAKPKDFIPNTKMSFIGLKKPEDRANMIAYMQTMSPSPQK